MDHLGCVEGKHTQTVHQQASPAPPPPQEPIDELLPAPPGTLIKASFNRPDPTTLTLPAPTPSNPCHASLGRIDQAASRATNRSPTRGVGTPGATDRRLYTSSRHRSHPRANPHGGSGVVPRPPGILLNRKSQCPRNSLSHNSTKRYYGLTN